jgi:hypothetical protein
LPVITAQFTQFYRQVLRHTVKSLSLTQGVWGTLDYKIIYRVTIKEMDTFNVIKTVSTVDTQFA